MSPLSKQGGYLVDLKVSNHSAVGSIMSGEGNFHHIATVVAMYNMARSLVIDGFGEDHGEVILAAQKALTDLANRYTRIGKYVPTGPEIKAIKDLLELQDAQLDYITVGQLEAARQRALKDARENRNLHISTHYLGDISPEFRPDSRS